MIKILGICICLSMMGMPGCRTPREADLEATYLRCEYLHDPLGIDEVKPRLSWIPLSPERSQGQSAYRIVVASYQALLEKDKGDLWDTGKIASGRTSQIEYAGKALKSGMSCFWKVRLWDKNDAPGPFSDAAVWSMGFLQPEDWTADWIALNRDIGAASAPSSGSGPPPPWFRKTFPLEKKIRRATVYVTARGIFELRINGRRVGRDVFAPEWTDYDTRIQYRTYDVTEHLQVGINAIGAIVGDGWFSGRLGLRPNRGHYGLDNSLLLVMEIEFSDGSRKRINTDETWLSTTGPVLASDMLLGETYDARREMPGWDQPDFDDTGWKPAAIAQAPQALLVTQPSEPIRVTETIPPVSMTEPEKGIFVFDLGQNIAGWVRLKVSGAEGTRITLRHAERLNPDGTIYTENLRSAKATDVYILKGGGEEIYEPRFTFHGFQYVEVSGYPGPPDLDSITGCAINSDLPVSGSFICSHPMVNRLFENLVWSQRGNYISIPTDCPQRDERLGWMGDAQIFIRTGTFNMDAAAFFTKWMQDVADAQSDAGAFPDFAPRLKDTSFRRFEAAPAWGDAGVIVPWVMYRVYGDTRIIAKHWQAMVRWMNYLRTTNPDLIRRRGVNNNYGDWLSIGADTPKDLLATAYWGYDALLMSRMAEVIGRQPEAQAYTELFEDIRGAFVKTFVSEDGRIQGETQTGYLLALAMELLPESLRDRAAAHLVENIRKHDDHLTTGFVGCGYLNPVLTLSGYADVAYRLLLNDTFPSWGYSIAQGATTIWERWDGWTEDKGFQNPGMNSFNHYAFGAVGEWLYRFVAGIDLDPDIPGYKRFLIRPIPGGGLTVARAEYLSIHGRIQSAWRIQDGRMTMEVTIPTNTTAEIYVPNPEAVRIQESGKTASEAEGVRFLRSDDNRSVFEVQSGSYRFIFPFEADAERME